MQANPYRAEEVVTLGFGDDEKQYKLAYDVNTVAQLERALNKSLPEILESLDEGRIGFSFVLTGLTCGLQKHHRGLTEPRVGALFDSSRLDDYVKAVVFCLMVAVGGNPEEVRASMAGAAEDETSPGEAPAEETADKSGTGPSSSASPGDTDSPPTNSGP